MKKINKEKKKGFTLVEMLAVVVILALLVGIATPIVNNIIKKARLNSFLSTYDTLVTNFRTDILLNNSLLTDCDDSGAATCKAKYQYDNATLKITNDTTYNTVTLTSKSAISELGSNCPTGATCGTDNKTITFKIDNDGKVFNN